MTRAKILGQNIKKYREAKKFSQEFLAEKLDFSREYISRIERGQKSISLRKLFLLADVLEAKVSDLMNFD
ncbi:MAG: helix-turn-helix transcriptional regulator [Candidatus Gastranaerophilales bacterium]|nr:helix-turn-helix transcriptional regulator [Candidatus Gastranaerophilales bacterium]